MQFTDPSLSPLFKEKIIDTSDELVERFHRALARVPPNFKNWDASFIDILAQLNKVLAESIDLFKDLPFIE